jgi:hypothetical protein
MDVPTLSEYTRRINRDGFSVVDWGCDACGVSHLEDHEVCEDGVRCCCCGADFALLPKRDLAAAIEAEPSEPPDVEAILSRYHALALSRRTWIDAATSVLGPEWNGTPDDLRRDLAALLARVTTT